MNSIVSESETAIEKGQKASFAVSAAEVVQRLHSDVEHGLTEDQIQIARNAHGRNQLTEAPLPPVWRKLAGQFKDLVIWTLIVAAVISGALGEWVDTLAIMSIVLLNGAIGFVQEERAGKALAALQKLSAPNARVVREGRTQTLPANELVPGDRVELEAGDNIPADVRLLRSFGFQVQEAALTGESMPVEKSADAILPTVTSLGDRHNMAFMGTVAAAGKASAVVVATGMTTELGRIAGLLTHQEPEPTPLQRRLAELGRVLFVGCLAIVAVVFGLQLLRGGDVVQVFLMSVSLAVAAVPEGLPAVVTIALALGLQRMVKRNALVRKLPSVETLGCVTVICSDKTGTLTRNEMTVRELIVGDAEFYVSGAGYVPHGSFYLGRALVDKVDRNSKDVALPVDVKTYPELTEALAIGAWCNNAQLVPMPQVNGGWQVIGDPTEGALLVAARKAGLNGEADKPTLLYELPFDSTRKAMSVVLRLPNGKVVLYTKGAPEVILDRSTREQRNGSILPLDTEQRREWLDRNAAMASRALRVLALAYRYLPDSDPGGFVERELTFVGLVGMIDPPRDEAREAVQRCKQAGIRPVMITGDHPATAEAVAKELQLPSVHGSALTGADLDQLSDTELSNRVTDVAVYARVSAEHKLRVVRAWKSRGQIVAMTGDGVNDAPAIKAADIGIAMGIMGTDVTKEASDMVLMDDNFASIVNAVEEGRGIFDNIQKVLLFLLSCNFGEILLMLVASLLGWPMPLLPIQLLWINLVTDGLPALALSLEPPEPGIMARPPRPAKEPILSARLGWTIAFQGMLVGMVGLAAFGIGYWFDSENTERARAMTFCVVVYAELLRSLAARSPTYTLGQLGWFSNPSLLLAVSVSGLLQISVVFLPFVQPMFVVAPHYAWEWIAIVLLAFTPVTVIEVYKLLRRSVADQQRK